MTVCLATLLNWNYGTREAPSVGKAALVMSDRKITAGDVEYEPNQQKIAIMPGRATLIAIAGEVSIHSEAIKRTYDQSTGITNASPYQIATFYGQAIQAIKRRQAEDLYLAPLGLNTDTFVAQQRDYSDKFVDRITDQLQQYNGADVEGLVVGCDGERVHILQLDSRGNISAMDDIGFAAIGIGSWHARSRLMQSGYVNTHGYS
jgi:20S proteasome alpha/beta subunit